MSIHLKVLYNIKYENRSNNVSTINLSNDFNPIIYPTDNNINNFKLIQENYLTF